MEEKTVNQALLARLEDLRQQDIDMRQKLLAEGRLYGSYDTDMQRVHTENAQALDEIITQHGWPGIASVGLAGCRAAWLIAQHAICTPALQRKFLERLTAAAEAGDVPLRQVALLSDRVRFNEGRPQLYGTVMDWDERGEFGCELEDPEQVDERRAAVGLPPYAEALAEHRREVEAEGGGPPGDFAAYRQAVVDWARRVGWR